MRNKNALKEEYKFSTVIDLPSNLPLFQVSHHRIDLESYATRLLVAIRPREGENTLKQLAADIAYDTADIRSGFNAIHEWTDPSHHVYGAISALQALAAGVYLNQPGGRKIPGTSYQIGNKGYERIDADEYVERFLKAVRVREGDTTLRQLVLDLNQDAHTVRQEFIGKSSSLAASSRMYGTLDVLHAVVGRIMADQPAVGSGGPIPPGAKQASLSNALAL